MEVRWNGVPLAEPEGPVGFERRKARRRDDVGEGEEAVTISTTHAISSRAAASDATRWGQLIFGIICMVMIANLQYGWTLVRQSHRSEIPLGTCGDPSRIHNLRADRNLAGSVRGVSD